jgi:hypothetical protein
MNFTNQYLSYTEYKELGGTLEEVPFNELEFECRKIIDSRTQNRLHSVIEIPDEVKMCEFKMINNIVRYNESKEQAQSGVKSENIDGYSVTYLTSSEIQQLITSQIADMQELISTYLFGVIVNNEHILYCGVV